MEEPLLTLQRIPWDKSLLAWNRLLLTKETLEPKEEFKKEEEG
jgi:hypothetical protein